MPSSIRSSNLETNINFGPGIQADTLLRVFHQDFEVHSQILRLHSNYFCTFFESSDKQIRGTSTNTQFRYEWTTQVDSDGTGWCLVCATSPSLSSASSTSALNPEAEIAAFTILIKSIYSIPFTFGSAAQFCLLTKMADYYGALPIVSRWINDALPKSPRLIDAIHNYDNVLDILDAAYQLQNWIIFKECLILAMGPEENPLYLQISQGDLRDFADKCRAQIDLRLREFQQAVEPLLNSVKHCDNGPNLKDLIGAFRRYNPHRLPTGLGAGNEWEDVRPCLAHLYGWLVHDSRFVPLSELMRRCVKQSGLLQSNLTMEEVAKREKFSSDRGARFGGISYHQHFLFLEIEGEDLPWDVNEREW